MRVGNLAADAIQATTGRQFTVGTPPDILCKYIIPPPPAHYLILFEVAVA